jgi:hypothetical protein
MTPCKLVDRYQSLGRNCYLHILTRDAKFLGIISFYVPNYVFGAQEGYRRFLQNVCQNLKSHTLKISSQGFRLQGYNAV